MINFTGIELRNEFKEAFGFDISNLNLKQLWWLVKFAKHVRGRCRNNSAFNNYMNNNFSPANFREVPKEYNGRSYMGLRITSANGETSENASEE